MNNEVSNYLSNLLPNEKDWVKDLQRQAKIDHVPIMDPVSMQFVMQLIRLNKPKRILEIGTAIGYSALRMLEANPESSIFTIEKDEARYEQAVNNIKKYDLNKKVKIIYGDASEVMENELPKTERFDCVFIDAAKGQYKSYFNLADKLLEENGFIIADNVLFKGYIANANDDHPRRYRKLIKKLKEFNEWISNLPSYRTSIVPIGDGVAISYKNSREEF
ncbi:MAG TPA: O-methyltransferase [Candidatus Avamphibacillus sp.]|nr:O-methyltransferase [Candidatus Avamphibacillus sp.]